MSVEYYSFGTGSNSAGQGPIPGTPFLLGWGHVVVAADGTVEQAVVFTTPFPNTVLEIVLGIKGFTNSPLSAQWDTATVAGFRLTVNGGQPGTFVTVSFLAIGS